MRMILGNVFADVGGAVQQQAVADDCKRRIHEQGTVVSVALDDEG